MNGITSVAKKAFKFHCDSINMIEDNSDSVPYKSFKFHCDSINMTLNEIRNSIHAEF